MDPKCIQEFTTTILMPQFRLGIPLSFITIYSSDGNIVSPSYWKAMCGFIKGKKSVFVPFEQHVPSYTFIYILYQGRNTGKNSQENNNNRKQYHQCRNMIPRKHQYRKPHRSINHQYIRHLLKTHTEAIQPRRSTISNLVQRLSTYAQ